MIAAPIRKAGSGFGEVHWTSSPDGRRTGIPWQIPLWQMFLKFPTVGHPHGGVRIPTKSPGYNGMMSPGIPE